MDNLGGHSLDMYEGVVCPPDNDPPERCSGCPELGYCDWDLGVHDNCEREE
jgi:hypothetical protein